VLEKRIIERLEWVKGYDSEYKQIIIWHAIIGKPVQSINPLILVP
jgi:hypothetical protein